MLIRGITLALLLVHQTRIVQLPDKEIVRRENFVVAATVDGFICYGTKEPRAVNCHRAIRLRDELTVDSADGDAIRRADSQ